MHQKRSSFLCFTEKQNSLFLRRDYIFVATQNIVLNNVQNKNFVLRGKQFCVEKKQLHVTQKIILCRQRKADVAQKVFHLDMKMLILHRKVFNIDKSKLMLHRKVISCTKKLLICSRMVRHNSMLLKGWFQNVPQIKLFLKWFGAFIIHLTQMKFDGLSTKDYLVTYCDVHTYSHIYQLYIRMFSSVIRYFQQFCFCKFVLCTLHVLKKAKEKSILTNLPKLMPRKKLFFCKDRVRGGSFTCYRDGQ